MEIGPLKRVWIGCVEARDALNGCFKRIEASLLYQCGKLRAKAARSGCLMYDHAPAGFPHRNLDGFDVERNECAQVDNLRIYVQIGYGAGNHMRSEEHTSELQSLMRISYAVFCLKKKT